MIILEKVLTPERCDALRATLEREAAFEDGLRTAGRYAAAVKRNEQLAKGALHEAVVEEVGTALRKHSVFLAAAWPKSFVRLLVSRYREGMHYGPHVDDAFIGASRADLTFTLFLTPPDAYSGGELIVEEPLGARSFKLEPGQALLYPSTSLHRVTPVTVGTRLAVVGWVTSRIKLQEQRALLFELQQAIAELEEKEGKSPTLDRLALIRSNLLRLWGEA